MIIKVCGMRDPQNIRDVENLGIDMMGFICCPSSPRHVSEPPAYLPLCTRVGVFVDAGVDHIATTVAKLHLNYIQLHGHESPDFCRQVRQLGKHIIKAVAVTCPDDLRGLNYPVDLLLFDAKQGGSGQQWSWQWLAAYDGNIPFLLAGGIGPDDAARVRSISHPLFAGVDLNSHFEAAPALKDIDKLKAFINEQNR